MPLLSTWMIELTQFRRPTKTQEDKHTFIDLRFDIEPSTAIRANGLYSINNNAEDVAVDVDTQAIRNSLYNLFNTRPGQYPLSPTYGLNLTQYLGEANNDSTALLIGEAVYSGITRFEPRIQLVNVNVEPKPEQDAYEITISFNIPKINNSDLISITGSLNQQNFSY